MENLLIVTYQKFDIIHIGGKKPMLQPRISKNSLLQPRLASNCFQPSCLSLLSVAIIYHHTVENQVFQNIKLKGLPSPASQRDNMQHRELKKIVEYHVTNGVTQKIFCFSHFINLIYINRFKEEVSFQTDSSKVRVGPFSGSLCFMKKKCLNLN